MKTQIPHLAGAGAVLAAMAACAGPAHRPIVGEPTGHPGFPAEARIAGVRVEARFVEDHERALGLDVVRAAGVVPVALRVGVRDEDAGEARLDAVTLDPVLYLEDGTTLPWVPLEELDLEDARVAVAALPTTVVPGWDASRPGFLFFSSAARDVRVQGRHALVVGEDLNRELDLVGSVVALTVETEQGPARVHVGLALDHWEASR